MPKIKLKPNSPEFFDDRERLTGTGSRPPHRRSCDVAGCPGCGEFRAPKDRSLSEHYWFCLEHVSEYNRAWNFFQGMNQSEVEEQILGSLYGDRPTRRYDTDALLREDLKRKIWQTYSFTEYPPSSPDPSPKTTQNSWINPNTPEYQALVLLGLEPPLTLLSIKTRYKELAKKYHPDYNPGDKKAEDLLKQINMAYTILKGSYEKFEKLEER